VICCLEAKIPALSGNCDSANLVDKPGTEKPFATSLDSFEVQVQGYLPKKGWHELITRNMRAFIAPDSGNTFILPFRQEFLFQSEILS